MTIIEAAKLGARWMEWWLQNQECDCEGGHSCGRNERLLELDGIKGAIKAAQDGPCDPVKSEKV